VVILLCKVKRGKDPPKIYLKRPFAAMADAAVRAAYVSIRYMQVLI